MSAAAPVNHAITSFSEDARNWVHPGIQSRVKNEAEFDKFLRHAGDNPAIFWNMVYISSEHNPLPEHMIPSLPDYFAHPTAIKQAETLLKNGTRIDTFDKLKTTMLALHKLMLPENPNKPNIIAGVFRKAAPGLLLLNKSKERVAFVGTFYDFLQKYEPTSLTRQFVKEVHKAQEVLKQKGIDFEQISKDYPTFAEVFLKHHVVFPSAKKIDKLMKKLFEDFSEKLKTGDAIAAACFLHQGIVTVHPFDDGNGRIARLMMNFVLMQNGHSSIGFDRDSTYTAAVQKDQTDAKSNAFYEFVKPMVESADKAVKAEQAEKDGNSRKAKKAARNAKAKEAKLAKAKADDAALGNECNWDPRLLAVCAQYAAQSKVTFARHVVLESSISSINGLEA